MNPFKTKLDLKYIGPTKWLLSTEVNIDQEAGVVTLSQRKFIQELLQKFNFGHMKRVGTPIETTDKSEVEKPEPFEDQRLYQSATGALTYLATITRPDIAFATSKAATFNANPTEDTSHFTTYQQKIKLLIS